MTYYVFIIMHMKFQNRAWLCLAGMLIDYRSI